MGPVVGELPERIAWSDVLRLMIQSGFIHKTGIRTARHFVPRKVLRVKSS